MTEYKALSGRTRASLQDLEHVIQRIEMLRGKAAKTGDDGYNVYTFNLRPSRLAELVDDLAACLDAVRRDLSGFSAFLDTLA